MLRVLKSQCKKCSSFAVAKLELISGPEGRNGLHCSRSREVWFDAACPGLMLRVLKSKTALRQDVN